MDPTLVSLVIGSVKPTYDEVLSTRVENPEWKADEQGSEAHAN